MSDEVLTPDAKATETSSYEAPSLGSILDKVQGKTPTEPVDDKPEETAVASEVKEPIVETPVAETPAEEETIDSPEPELVPEAGVDKPRKGYIPVSVAQAERQKRQQLEAQLQTYALLNQQLQQAQLQAAQYQPTQTYEQPVAAEPDPNVMRNQIATVSERLARQTYKDYDEKYGAFAKAFNTNPQKYQALYESIMGSEHPGEAAYRAGEQIVLAEKYGADVVANPARLIEAVRKETEAELKPKVAAETHAKIQGKLTERSKTPTDISQARSSGGQTVADYQTPSLAQVLAKVQKRKR